MKNAQVLSFESRGSCPGCPCSPRTRRSEVGGHDCAEDGESWHPAVVSLNSCVVADPNAIMDAVRTIAEEPGD